MWEGLRERWAGWSRPAGLPEAKTGDQQEKYHGHTFLKSLRVLPRDAGVLEYDEHFDWYDEKAGEYTTVFDQMIDFGWLTDVGRAKVKAHLRSRLEEYDTQLEAFVTMGGKPVEWRADLRLRRDMLRSLIKKGNIFKTTFELGYEKGRLQSTARYLEAFHEIAQELMSLVSESDLVDTERSFINSWVTESRNIYQIPS